MAIHYCIPRVIRDYMGTGGGSKETHRLLISGKWGRRDGAAAFAAPRPQRAPTGLRRLLSRMYS